MDAPVKAVLGPTNTGKTHLAIERMCAHSSGMIGFPLRLLAREVYDRVVAIKGAASVGLITGEEKILPPNARWLLCTAESMPLRNSRASGGAPDNFRDVAFLALDEAQIGADPERGHVFTDRLLRARGREETMILGSAALAPMVRALVPKAEIIARPRFSTLSYGGAKKLSRLPKRSAIVAFSADEVYAVAEMLRRSVGGAAVVMGMMSPRTRNAQVAMFQSGEVDYLVATDAIGMGLNLDITHVAFASLSKFDGRRQRRLTIGEMAQIAGRAGRHQRDGSFGSLGSGEGRAAFRPQEIEAIETHDFPRLESLYWRSGTPSFASIEALIDSLEARPNHSALKPAPQVVDLAVLKLLAGDPGIADQVRGTAAVQRLWAACSLPDFRKLGADHHARMVTRAFRHLNEGAGHIPVDWIADEIARLDRADGDIDTLGGRIAAARTWAYIAHRPDWLADPAHWAGRARDLEEKLSDALHARLTERFVDRRTAVLARAIGGDPDLFKVAVGADGVVTVEDEAIGHLSGFVFTVDPAARSGERRKLLAAAERHLVRILAGRAAALTAASDDAFTLAADVATVTLRWGEVPVATLARGKTLVTPKLKLHRAIDRLPPPQKDAVRIRITDWLSGHLRSGLAPLFAMAATAGDLQTPAPVRALLAPLVAAGGDLPREPIEPVLSALDPGDRQLLRRAGLTIGTLDIFDGRLIKPRALRLRALLAAVYQGAPVAGEVAGETIIATDAPGFRRFGGVSVRIDLVERIARALHDTRSARTPFVPDAGLATGFGVDAATFTAILRACGFRPAAANHWRWHGRPRARPLPLPVPSGAFAALGALY